MIKMALMAVLAGASIAGTSSPPVNVITAKRTDCEVDFVGCATEAYLTALGPRQMCLKP